LDILAYSACLGLILFMGGQPERVGAAIIIIGSLATGIVSAGVLGSSSWDRLETGILLVDVTVLAALWGIALSSNRFWPYWVTAWQLIAILVHLQMVFFANIMPNAYSYTSRYLAFPMVLLMLFASVNFRVQSMQRSA
jgi:hypothetical protein